MTGVQTCALPFSLADVVRNDPQVQPTLVRNVFTDTTDKNTIGTGSLADRSRITARLAFVHQHHTGRPPQQLMRLLRSDLFAGFDVHCLGMAIGSASGREMVCPYV